MCTPGTESDVMSMVNERRKKMVPPKLHMRRKMIERYLCVSKMVNMMMMSTRPIISVAKNAHGTKKKGKEEGIHRFVVDKVKKLLT